MTGRPASSIYHHIGENIDSSPIIKFQIETGANSESRPFYQYATIQSTRLLYKPRLLLAGRLTWLPPTNNT